MSSDAEQTKPTGGKASVNIHQEVGNLAAGGKATALKIGHHEGPLQVSIQAAPPAPGASPAARLPDFPAPDILPEPARSLPPGSRPPPAPRNALFTGRESDLLAAARLLFHERKATIVCGMGGVGKSQLAVELAYRYAPYLYGVHWINAQGDLTGNVLAAEVAACGLALGVQPWPDKLPEQVAATRRAWAAEPRRLVVLDNLEDPQVLQDWLAAPGGTFLLVTARDCDWPPDLGAQPLPLGVLPRTDSLALLRKLARRLRQAPDPGLDPLAGRLGDLPLALDLAGRYLAEDEALTVQEYLDELAGGQQSIMEHPSLLEELGYSPTRHATSLLATFGQSWTKVTGELAQAIFRAAGYCAPNTPIPEGVLRAAAGEGTPLRPFRRALKGLVRLGLLSQAEGGPSVHPLLADFARYQDRQVSESVLPGLVQSLIDLSYQANEAGFPRQFLPLLPHVRLVAQAALKANLGGDAATLISNLGYHLMQAGDYPAARPYYEGALAVNREVLGEQHPGTATSLNNLGVLLQDMGDYPASRPYMERALAIRREVLGEAHPDTAASLNNLGLLLQDMGDYPAARSYMERALSIRREVLGEAHPGTAQSLDNLGGLLYAVGDYPAARAYMERALSIRREVLGEQHPLTALSLNNLGILLYGMGDYTAARVYYEQALAHRREVLGEKHPDTALSLNNLGMLLYRMGDYPAARPYDEQALAIRREVLGEQHPLTAASLNNLGLLLKAMGDYLAARPYYEQALAIFREILGEAHPDTANSLNNLGMLLQAMGETAAARPYLERALAIRREVLGEAHPDTALSLNNLGALLDGLGDYPAAWPYYEQALAIRREVLGEAHPDTAQSLNNLAGLLQAMGETAAARLYYEQALAIQREILGEQHSDTAASLNNLGVLLYSMGETAAARPYLERALAIRREALGEAHPDTITCLLNLAYLSWQAQDPQAAGQLVSDAARLVQDLPQDHPSRVKVVDFMRTTGIGGEAEGPGQG